MLIELQRVYCSVTHLTALVKHYRTHRENWDGGFSRNKARDDSALFVNPMPSDALDITDLCVNGHRISYKGKCNVAFNTDEDGRLMAEYALSRDPDRRAELALRIAALKKDYLAAQKKYIDF